MKIIESYMPVFQKWGDNDLSIYYEAKGFQYYDSTTIFDCCFLYYGYKVTYAMQALHSSIHGMDLRELMMAYKTGRAV